MLQTTSLSLVLGLDKERNHELQKPQIVAEIKGHNGKMMAKTFTNGAALKHFKKRQLQKYFFILKNFVLTETIRCKQIKAQIERRKKHRFRRNIFRLWKNLHLERKQKELETIKNYEMRRLRLLFSKWIDLVSETALQMQVCVVC